EGGPLRFYAGFPTFYVRIAPHAMITLIAQDGQHQEDLAKDWPVRPWRHLEQARGVPEGHGAPVRASARREVQLFGARLHEVAWRSGYIDDLPPSPPLVLLLEEALPPLCSSCSFADRPSLRQSRGCFRLTLEGPSLHRARQQRLRAKFPGGTFFLCRRQQTLAEARQKRQ
ncbi:unnamed protein product, partial [Prorocentrum cordatum]